MNKTTRVLLSVLVIILLIPCLGFAQDKDEPNTVIIVKYAMNWAPEGGSIAEMDSLWALASKNIIKKNKYIKSQMVVAHYYGSNSEDMLIIREFNGSGLDIILKASKENTRLFKEWKSDEEDSKEWSKAVGKYYKGGHSDEIYVSMNKVNN